MDEISQREKVEEEHNAKPEIYTNLASRIAVLSENIFDLTAISRLGKQEIDLAEPGIHQLTIAVTISLAVSLEKENSASNINIDSTNTSEKIKKSLESPKAQRFFRLEYELLPGDDSPVRIDLVVYGAFAKIYAELEEPKTVKTWTHGSAIWISWTNCHSVTVTESLLQSLIAHQVVLHIWEGKDKVNSKARFDRPKGSRLLKSDDVENNIVRSTILQQRKNYSTFRFGQLDLNPAEAVSDILIQTKSSAKNVAQIQNDSPSTTNLQKSKVILKAQQNVANTEVPSPLDHELSKERSSESDIKGKRNENRKLIERESKSILSEEMPKSKQKKSEIDQNGLCSISLPFARFYTGTATVTECLTSSVDPVLNVYMTVALDKPLLSEEQAVRLNPLVIQVRSATNLPNEPVTFEELRKRCKSAYIKYKIFDAGERISKGVKQDRDLYWNDINIILTGLMDSSVLREYLAGPRLEIEVHDRDRIIAIPKDKGFLFGQCFDDDKISNVATVTSRRTIQNAFQKHEKPWDPFGVASFDLSELLLGQTVLFFEVPICSCPAPEVFGLENRKNGLVGLVGAVDGPADAPITSSDYLWSNAHLKVKVQLAHPLTTPSQLASKVILDLDNCPFARAVFKFEHANTSFLHKLHSYVTEVNIKALGLVDVPSHVRSTALATYTLSEDQATDQTLDVITGFQVNDGETVLFVLEGLRNFALKKLTEEMIKELQPDIQVLYHSNLGFQKRLYASLGADIHCVKLHEPLSVIMKQPKLYIRDMVPSAAFQGLYKIQMLFQTNKLRDAVRNDLFPSASVVVSLSREFGLPVEACDFQEINAESATKAEEDMVEEVDRHNKEEEKALTSSLLPVQDRLDGGTLKNVKLKKRETQNWSRRNKKNVTQLSDELRLKKSKSPEVMIQADVDVAYNYGNQKLNSVELAKDKLREIIAKEKDVFFSYCPEYHHSMTFPPYEMNQLSKELALKSKKRWLTTNGWTHPNKRSTVQKRLHPKNLHPAAVDELQIPADELYNWDEASFITREPYPWEDRKLDMDIWTTPPKFEARNSTKRNSFEMENYVGAEEEKILRQQQLDEWKAKVVVDDVRQRFHRCAIDTELLEFGPKSANQIARLRGLLKDCPQKYSLKKLPMGQAEIPALGVVNYPSVDVACQKKGRTVRSVCPGEDVKCFNPGSFTMLRLSHPSNSIPTVNYDHKVFQEKKGSDFKTFFHEKKKVYTRPILPIKEEKCNQINVPCSFWSEYLESVDRIQERNIQIARSLMDKPPLLL